MKLGKVLPRAPRWCNRTRPRIFAWYILLTAFTSVASILTTHHILYERIRDQSEIYVARQMRAFQALVQKQQEQPGDLTIPAEQQAATLIDGFLSQYEPVNEDDYAIALLQGRVHQYTELFPTELLTQDTALIEQWGRLIEPKQGSVQSRLGELSYFAEPVIVDGQPQGVLVIVHCGSSFYKVVDRALLLIIPATLGVIAIASAIAWATAGRVLAPLRSLTKITQSITESDMTQRITVEGTDEVAQLTATFNDMLDRLQVAFTSQQEFLKDASHELRTPITIIRGYLETLQYRPDRQEQNLALAIDELDRMNRLVNDLLLLARAERPDFLQPKPEELDWLMEELYLKARSMGDRQWVLESKGLSPIQLDRHRITQAVMNLVQNAIRHTQPGDVIALGSSVQGSTAQIWVRDTGEGISPEDQARIFDRFTRATTQESPGENYGLGLSIVEAIAQAHGGSIELVSQPGQSSTFTLVLPLDAHPVSTTHDSDSDYRRQPAHHRLSRIRAAGPWLHDHRR